MGKRYSHLQPIVRVRIYELLFQGLAIADIANQIGYHRSTIYRELERNSCQQGYRPDAASQCYLARRRRRPVKLETQPELKHFVISKLPEGWSPDQISRTSKKSTEANDH